MRYAEELSDVVQKQLALAYSAKDLLGFGLRQCLRDGYRAADFRADLLSALVVGVVALPLSMALAIAAGARPEMGLFTAIIAGVLCALLGGTRFQVTGPTAAFALGRRRGGQGAGDHPGEWDLGGVVGRACDTGRRGIAVGVARSVSSAKPTCPQAVASATATTDEPVRTTRNSVLVTAMAPVVRSAP